jgi:hypothetical protein
MKPEDYYTTHSYHFYDIIDLCQNLDYVYEFGVYGGKSMLDLLNQAYRAKKPVKNFFGFDSFSGVPISEDYWTQGDYDCSNLFQIPSIECGIKIETLAKILFPNCNTNIFSCLFNEIKTQPTFKPASFINIDCDIYSSAKTSLEFMYINKLIKIGTIISYDDLIKNEEFSRGEGLAHLEWINKYNIKCKQHKTHIFEVIDL